MTHGDEKGLRLPPKIAPYQLVVVPIFKSEEDKKAITKFINPILNELKKLNIRIHEDWRKESPGFKFNEWEMKGVPLRLEIGLRDIKEDNVTLSRRDKDQKFEIQKSKIVKQVPELLDKIQSALYKQALEFRSLNTHKTKDYEEFKEIMKNNGGFVRCGWDGDEKTEKAIKR